MTTPYRDFGVIRRYGIGDWRTIDDAMHRSEGIASISYDHTGKQLIIHYTHPATRVLTGYAAPDETLAAAGIVVGPSIGFETAMVKFGRNSVQIDPEAITSSSANVWINFELEVDE